MHRLRSERGDTDPMLTIGSIAVILILGPALAGLITILISWTGISGQNATSANDLKVAGTSLAAELQSATAVHVVSPTEIQVIEGHDGSVVVDASAPPEGEFRWQDWTFGDRIVERVGTAPSSTTAPTKWHNVFNVPQVKSAELTLTNASGRTILVNADGSFGAPSANPAPSKIESFRWTSNVVKVASVAAEMEVEHPHVNPLGRAPYSLTRARIGGFTYLPDPTNYTSIGTIPTAELHYYAPLGTPSATVQGAVGTTAQVTVAAGAPNGPACGALSMKDARVAVTPATETTGGTGATTYDQTNVFYVSGLRGTLTMPAGSAYDVVETLQCFPQPTGNQKDGAIPSSTSVVGSGVTTSGTRLVVPLNAPKPSVSWNQGAQAVNVSWAPISTIPVTYSLSCSMSLSHASWSTTTTGTSASWPQATGSAYGQTVNCSVSGKTSAVTSPTGTAAADVAWPSITIRPRLSGQGADGEQPVTRTIVVTTAGSCPAGTAAQTRGYDSGIGKDTDFVGGNASYAMSENYGLTYLANGQARCASSWSVSATYSVSAKWATAAHPPAPRAPYSGCGLSFGYIAGQVTGLRYSCSVPGIDEWQGQAIATLGNGKTWTDGPATASNPGTLVLIGCLDTTATGLSGVDITIRDHNAGGWSEWAEWELSVADATFHSGTCE
ncbi:hypothetical protein [Gryllotalpicola protaetiae]|uniref:Uncharacterized protein n=1 Tax=Gryllotalpicola protaetiae TaxID=2419771 RepID=A0A387BQY1_9MICO|nr:hypothetical protein [Gryllotalpicola protaetiae]AYG03440.1 hypothetical protein D7I44_07745 [Gryllotalpicola protaetiae]